MGGIVATESILSSVSDHETPYADGIASSSISILPYVQGVLAFDTPYLGIAPSVLIHGVGVPYQSVHTLYERSKKPKNVNGGPDRVRDRAWKQWVTNGIVVLFLAGSAYFTRSALRNGWEWVSSYLIFVECLLRRGELKYRLERMVSVAQEREMGFTNLVVVLGEWNICDTAAVIEKAARGEMRSFCEVDHDGVLTTAFQPVKNVKAGDEITAHMSIFVKQKNLGYEELKIKSLHMITSWVQQWYNEGDDNWRPAEART
jgi:hypothetical protein